MKYTQMDPTPFQVRRTSGLVTPVASFVADDRHGSLAHVVQVEQGMFTLYLSDGYSMRMGTEFVPYAKTGVWPMDIIEALPAVVEELNKPAVVPLSEWSVRDLRAKAAIEDIDLGKLRLKKDIVAAIEGTGTDSE